MRKGLIITLVAIAIIACWLKVGSWMFYQQDLHIEWTKLQCEIASFQKEYGEDATQLALSLIQNKISQEDYGRFRQRIDFAHEYFDNPFYKERFDDILTDLFKVAPQQPENKKVLSSSMVIGQLLRYYSDLTSLRHSQKPKNIEKVKEFWNKFQLLREEAADTAMGKTIVKK